MVLDGRPAEELLDACAAWEAGRDSGDFQPFDRLCDALSLEACELLCVAAVLSRRERGLTAMRATELSACYRRLGGRRRHILAGLFADAGGRAVLHPVVTDFLDGNPPRLGAGMRMDFCPDAPVYHSHDLLDSLDAMLAGYLKDGAPFPLALVVRGTAGSGRKFLLSRAARSAGLCMLILEERALSADSVGDIPLLSALYGAIPCFDGESAFRRFLAVMREPVPFVFVAAKGELPPTDIAGYTAHSFEVQSMSGEEQYAALRDLCEGFPLYDPAREAVGETRLEFGRLLRYARRLRLLDAAGMLVKEAAGARTLLRQCMGHSQPAGTRALTGRAGMADLVLAPRQRAQFADLCGYAGTRDRVMREWNFRSKLPYGRGMSVLFYGPPGTGKTLAATVMANELGLPLMRVDLSQVISKYIGETQKNIGAVFDGAAGADCILFFDEADALFARRSEAGDSQDKYSNAEIAYLLQRTEEYDGICILATNLLQNFDEAFRRRIGYMLHFPLPDETLRAGLWRGIFPAEAPVGELDIPFLAARLELSGAGIKNCAVGAAHMAALEGGSIEMIHILRAARDEYAKQGRTPDPQVLRRLGE